MNEVEERKDGGGGGERQWGGEEDKRIEIGRKLEARVMCASRDPCPQGPVSPEKKRAERKKRE